MIVFAEVAIGSGGVSPCTRCTPSPTRTPRAVEEIVEELESLATRWDDGPGPNVSLVGFEPFAHPELPRLVGTASSKGFERIRLQTDAGALGMHDNAAGAFSAGVRHVEVVLLGASAEQHDRLSGRAGSFAAALKGLSAMRDLGPVTLTGLVPVCRHNVAELPAVVAVLAGGGCVAVHVDASGSPRDAASEAHVRAALTTATVNRAAAFVTGWDVPVAQPYLTSPWSVMER